MSLDSDLTVSYDRLRGLWEREVITYYDGRVDSSKIIYWIQATTIYADIRIPREMPEMRRHATLDSLSADEMHTLALCGGFAGTLELRDATSEWTRLVDWQPDGGVDDIATLSFDGLDLIEDGGACGGHQVWRRRTTSSPPTLGIRLRAEDGRTGFLVIAEERFVYMRGRRNELPPAFDLSTHLKSKLDEGLEAGRQLFDAEVSYGTISKDGLLEIEMSTLPWRQGDVLAAIDDVVSASGRIDLTHRQANGDLTTVAWTVLALENDGFGWPSRPLSENRQA